MQINLKNKDLKSTSKLYARIQTALNHETLSAFDIRLSWEPPKDPANSQTICPSSVAKYFSDLGYEVELSQTETDMTQKYRLNIPLFGKDVDQPATGQIPEFYATPHELVDYVGMLALDCSFAKQDCLNTWTIPGKSKHVETAMILKLTGFFTCELITNLMIALK